ncbi:MAG: tRNA lysidine(34) synthetase TilS [Acidobacteriaceae bacterium]
MKRIPKRDAVSAEPELPLDAGLLTAGDRVCVAVSGGADSTALLHALLSRRDELGIVLSVLHVNHGLRGAASMRDAEFVSALAEKFALPCEIVAVDTAKHADEQKETIEEAARNLRYRAFRQVLESGQADKIATAHTLDDQAETVLMKLVRGAWTEGLSGIHPTLRLREPAGSAKAGAYDCVRPLLKVRRTQIESYLHALGQPWREDETNQSTTYTRNRVRHALLPQMREYNPQIDEILGHLAANALAEEQHWQAELARVLPQVLLPGRPVRGGGRSVATSPGSISVAVDLARLETLDAGLRRRVLRAAAKQCGATLDFETTERLLDMTAFQKTAAVRTRTARRLELPGGVRAERSARELQFERKPLNTQSGKRSGVAPQAYLGSGTPAYELSIPGEVDAPAFGARYTAAWNESSGPCGESQPAAAVLPAICIRAWRTGDRAELRHSAGPKKVKEILARIGIRGEERQHWPVGEWQGRIVWMRGVEVTELPLGSHRDENKEASVGPGLQIREIRIGDPKWRGSA